MEYGIDKCDSKLEALEFMRLLRLEKPSADSDIGYLSGYYSAEQSEKIKDWFEVSHPIFGRGPTTPEIAFARGVAMGKKLR